MCKGWKENTSHLYELCLFVHSILDTVMVDLIMNIPKLTISQKQSSSGEFVDIKWS